MITRNALKTWFDKHLTTERARYRRKLKRLQKERRIVAEKFKRDLEAAKTVKDSREVIERIKFDAYFEDQDLYDCMLQLQSQHFVALADKNLIPRPKLEDWEDDENSQPYRYLKPEAAMRLRAAVRTEEDANWNQWARLVPILAVSTGLMAAYVAWLSFKSQYEGRQAEQRPWVSVQGVSISEPLQYDTNGIRMTLQFVLKNTGKNPGDATYVALQSKINGQPNSTWQKDVCNERSTDLGVSVFSGDLIGVGRVTYVPKSDFAQGADFKPVGLGSIRPVIAACVLYKDAVTGKWHRTPYSYVIQMKAPRPGHGCCSIVVADGDIPQGELSVLQWPLNQLGSD